MNTYGVPRLPPVSRTTVFKTVAEDAQPVEPRAFTDTAELHWRTHWWKAVRNDPELADMRAARLTLPEPVKTRVLAMVRASGDASDGAGG